MRIKDAFFVFAQYLLPQHFLSKIMHILTRCETRWWKNLQIKGVIQHYGVNLADAVETNPKSYPSFNHFFTRALKAAARPIPDDANTIISAADGAISQIGTLKQSAILQAKGKSFSVMDLLGGDIKRATAFIGGSFATIYLSPKDYHRLHMPYAGQLKEMIHVPGRLFSVNPTTTENVPNLFARNERVVAIFETEIGSMALVLIGAIFVASIETVWHGVVTPPSSNTIRTWDYTDNPIHLERGAEMGRFNMGSTIIALFCKNSICWSEELNADSPILMGQSLGQKNPG